jgi:hypothetical protein
LFAVSYAFHPHRIAPQHQPRDSHDSIGECDPLPLKKIEKRSDLLLVIKQDETSQEEALGPKATETRSPLDHYPGR